MEFLQINIRSYNGKVDKARVEDLERRCEVGPAEKVLLYTDTMGDPICRIRNSPLYNMLVAELKNEIVGLIQGSIKVVRLHKPSKDLAKVGYVLGLRVSPLHRRRGIGSTLVHHIEDWFITNQVHIAYMATQKDNEASVKLFVQKLGYSKFRTPSILVHPANNHTFQPPSNIDIVKLKVEQAELLYRKFMSSAEFFPHDIEKILRDKLSLGTWMAYYRNGLSHQFTIDGKTPNNWAMLSVWNSGELFKLRLGKGPLSCFLYSKCSLLVNKALPCFNVAPTLPDFCDPFGFYFIYGVYRQGPSSHRLVKTLCKFVHNFASETQDCKVIVTEIGGCDTLKHHIPHWKLLSCPEDLWCIKALRNEEKKMVLELTKSPPTRALFVDPREV